ncbi:HAD family hydrolase [Cryobacterium melibiosiphilum]|uniref:HAD family hydrolase n=1 Tax=Cryobacterium melibiosiphilum TaxID=995039 RepID=A0A3A5MFP7_9MICO|nr:HAD family hydrolase [Cryobacterium melibiosiphilum]RJT87641.1 HAD family hydrolase [Cryobacterium melibiosiphilum]
MQRPILIFDFDGTVALGDGPVLAYASMVAAAAGLGDHLRRDTERMLAAGIHLSATDAYDLVRMLAVGCGVERADLDEGYRRSRDLLATPTAPVVAPDGLADFLENTGAERMLVTNSPTTRLEQALVSLGLATSFDRIVTSAGKPSGLEHLLDELLQDGPRNILCIGDIWRNDLAPAHARGLITAHVGIWGTGDEPATYRAAGITALLPDLREWVRTMTISEPARQ